jgi:thioredoxin 1
MNLNEFNSITQSGDKKIVVISASWCAPCKSLKRTINSITDKQPHLKDHFIILDIDDCDEIVQAHEIQSVPTTFFINNKTYTEHKGLIKEQTILDFFK